MIRKILAAAFFALAPFPAAAQIAGPVIPQLGVTAPGVTPRQYCAKTADGRCWPFMSQDPTSGALSVAPPSPQSLLLALANGFVAPSFGVKGVGSVPLGDHFTFSAQNDPNIGALQVYGPNTAFAGLGSLYYDDVLRSVATVEPGAKAINTSALTTYVLNNSATSTEPNTGSVLGAGVGHFAFNICNVDNCAIWGAAEYDADSNGTAALPNAVGRGIIAHEYDLHAFAPTTKIYGLNLLLGGTPLYAQGFSVDSSGNQLFNYGYICADGAMRANGACEYRGLATKLVAGTAVGSIFDTANYYDGAARQSWSYGVLSNGNYLFTGTGKGDMQVAGHIVPLQQGGNPTASSCGTSPSVDTFSFDQGGAVTVGTGSPTSCIVSFGHAYKAKSYIALTPASPSAVASGAYVSQSSATGFQITFTTAQSTPPVFHWVAMGQ